MALRGAIADVAGQLALDANALSGLKQQAKVAPEAALAKAASQFEALFTQMLLKSMREALPHDGPLDSDTTKTYTGMLDQQLAQELSKKNGLGIADMLIKQLSKNLPKTEPSAGIDSGNAKDKKGLESTHDVRTARHVSHSSGLNIRPVNVSNTTSVDAINEDAKVTNATNIANATSTTNIASATNTLTTKAQSFIAALRPHAEAAAKAIGLPADFLLGQAALETGWGKSQPKTADGGASHNLFGIKAGKNWKGAVVEATTTEYVDGKAVKAVERFRSYASYADAFRDFGNLLRGNARYKDALASTADAKVYAGHLQRAGYATDPHYGTKLARAIEAVAVRGVRVATPVPQVIAGEADNSAKSV